jgi:hypothetical protein
VTSPSSLSIRQPLLVPETGQWFSLLLIGLFALSTIALAVKLAWSSPRVDAAIAAPLPEAVLRTIKYTVTVSLLVLSAFIAVDLVKALVRIARKRVSK